MIGHKICFNGEMWITIPKLSLLSLLIRTIVIFVIFLSREVSVIDYYMDYLAESVLIRFPTYTFHRE